MDIKYEKKNFLFLLIVILSTSIIFGIAKISEILGCIWLRHPVIALFIIIPVPLCVIGFISAFHFPYFPLLAEWNDKRDVKKMRQRFNEKNPHGTFKTKTERVQAFTEFIQDPDNISDLLE